MNQWLWDFKVPWSFGFLLGLPPRGGFSKIIQVTMKLIHLMSCRNPCRLYIHLTISCYFCPSSVVCNEPFSATKVLEVQWSHALDLMCEVALGILHGLGLGLLLPVVKVCGCYLVCLFFFIFSNFYQLDSHNTTCVCVSKSTMNHLPKPDWKSYLPLFNHGYLKCKFVDSQLD